MRQALDQGQAWGQQRPMTCLILALTLAFAVRMLEWPCWQNPEYRLGSEMLLATHDAYHWLAGATGFGLAVGHPMAVMLKWLAALTGIAPANIAFWLPPLMASMVAVAVCLWGWLLGNLQAGIAAGLIASIAPGFLARTLLGFYDTDLVTLLFPLLMALGPAWWMRACLLSPAAAWRQFRGKRVGPKANPLKPGWLLLLAFAGLFGWWSQCWHSVFPYLIRYDAALLPVLAVLFGQKGKRRGLLAASLCFSLAASAPAGIFYAFCLALALKTGKASARRFLTAPATLAILWLAAGCLFARGEIATVFLNQVNAYLKHTGDAHLSGAATLVFPSVAQSIIEVQDLSLAGLFSYFHPWLEMALAGYAGFGLIMLRRPGALFLLPLACLGLLSARLGGRMVMFGAPIVALGVAVPFFWLVKFCLGRWLPRVACGWLAAIVLCLALVAPFLHMVPELSQGPIINRRHAAALVQAGAITAPDAMLWLWWDWGYAAHYFSRRATIADGAKHGGPSLYLPAAVFATDNPRFARQIVRRTSSLGNEPGEFFRDMDGRQAQALITSLRSPDTQLVSGTGSQYVIVSFEMLKLGFWISNFGNWNFATCQGEGGALSIVPQEVAYKLNAGQVRLAGSPSIIYPASINIFAETGVTVRNYVQEWFQAHPGASPAEQKAWLATRRNINFLFNRVTDEKLAVDQGIYNSLMTTLLLCDPQDPRIVPYFRLVYDNVFARIYEVLPGS